MPSALGLVSLKFDSLILKTHFISLWGVSKMYFLMHLMPLLYRYLTILWQSSSGSKEELAAKISFNILLLNLAVRIIAIFLLIDLFIFSSWWWMFDRYISIIDRKMSNHNEYLINRFTSIVWKNSIVRQISIIKVVMFAPQRACRLFRDDVIEWKGNPCIPDLYFQNRNW